MGNYAARQLWLPPDLIGQDKNDSIPRSRFWLFMNFRTRIK
jgi:hypothetical protein